MTTVNERIAELEKPVRDERAMQLEILKMLPGDISAPTISNVKDKPHEEAGWLGFSAPSYDPNNTYNPLKILVALEDGGWKLSPATLVRKDNYRPSPEPGLIEDIPDEYGRYKVTETWVICPVWVTPEQHGKPELRCFMTAPNGKVYYVHVDINLPVRVSARRKDTMGSWHYERGTARIVQPDNWITLFMGDEPIAQRSVMSYAVVDTEQGISATIYWEPNDEQEDFPLTASGMLEILSK
jgi:hypothetical protein